ncbi:hypothetical protein QJQ45_020993, partial [Haematococcus lacustris]
PPSSLDSSHHRTSFAAPKAKANAAPVDWSVAAACIAAMLLSKMSRVLQLGNWKDILHFVICSCSEPEKLLANLVALQCPLVNFDPTLRLGAVSATLLAAAFPAANASVSQAWSAQATVLNASLSAVQLSQQQSASLSQRQDVYLVPSDYIPGFVSTKLIGSLEDVYQAQDDIAATTAADGTPMDSAWFSIDRVFREPSVLYNQIWGMPLGGSVTYLAYRPDVLSGLQLDPSLLASWEGLLQLVESDALRTLDMNGDGQPDFPFCFPRAQGCGVGALMTMAAPYVQTTGSKSGFLIDTTTGTSLLSSAAFTWAVQLFKRLRAVSPASEDADCGLGFNPWFLNASCAISLEVHSEGFKWYALDNSSRVATRYLLQSAPGATRVLDRESGKLVDCTAQTCPLAQPAPGSPTQATPGNPLTPALQADPSSSSASAPSTQARRQLQQVLLVNRAPLLIGVPVVLVANQAVTPAAVRVQAQHVMSALLDARTNWDLVLYPGSGVLPGQTHQWSPRASASAVWLSAGYPAAAVSSLLATWGASVEMATVNGVSLMKAQGLSQFLLNARRAVALACQELPTVVVVAKLNASLADTVLATYSSWSQFVYTYRRGLGYLEDIEPPLPSPPASSPKPPLPPGGAAALASGLALILLLWLLKMLAVYNAKRYRNLWGAVKAPGNAPDTTLLCVHVENYDRLWSALPSDVVERTLAAYTDLMTGLVNKHCGYTVSGGDLGSLVAFHCPQDAASFALSLQLLLLQERWPHQLLQHELFHPTRMLPRANGSSTARFPPTAQQPTMMTNPTATTASAPENKGLTFQQQCSEAWLLHRWSPTDPVARQSILTDNMLSGVQLKGIAGCRAASQQGPSQPAEATAAPGTGSLLSRILATSPGRSANGNDGVGSDIPMVSRGGVLVFCGLQVRTALCGVCQSELTLKRCRVAGTTRVTYAGEAVDIARELASSGQAGMTLIPQKTFRMLPIELMSHEHMFCHYGEYQLTSELPALDVYLALHKQLIGRLSLYKPLSIRPSGLMLSSGVLSAPVQTAAMVFTHMVGVQALLAWNYDLTLEALEVFVYLAQEELQCQGGYLVEHVSGFMLTAFLKPAAAILWSLRVQDAMMHEPWSDVLLSHEMCEEVIVALAPRLGPQAPAPSHPSLRGEGQPAHHLPSLASRRASRAPAYHSVASSGAEGQAESVLVFRGPRLKTGIDVGSTLSGLNTVTGRMAYRGKVMNRAARIASLAGSNQVLCSGEAWRGAGEEAGMASHMQSLVQGQALLARTHSTSARSLQPQPRQVSPLGRGQSEPPALQLAHTQSGLRLSSRRITAADSDSSSVPASLPRSNAESTKTRVSREQQQQPTRHSRVSQQRPKVGFEEQQQASTMPKPPSEPFDLSLVLPPPIAHKELASQASLAFWQASGTAPPSPQRQDGVAARQLQHDPLGDPATLPPSAAMHGPAVDTASAAAAALKQLLLLPASATSTESVVLNVESHLLRCAPRHSPSQKSREELGGNGPCLSPQGPEHLLSSQFDLQLQPSSSHLSSPQPLTISMEEEESMEHHRQRRRHAALAHRASVHFTVGATNLACQQPAGGSSPTHTTQPQPTHPLAAGSDLTLPEAGRPGSRGHALRQSMSGGGGQAGVREEGQRPVVPTRRLRLDKHVVGTSLGMFQLKGIVERLEVFHCTLIQKPEPEAAATAGLTNRAQSGTPRIRRASIMHSSPQGPSMESGMSASKGQESRASSTHQGFMMSSDLTSLLMQPSTTHPAPSIPPSPSRAVLGTHPSTSSTYQNHIFLSHPAPPNSPRMPHAAAASQAHVQRELQMLTPAEALLIAQGGWGPQEQLAVEQQPSVTAA